MTKGGHYLVISHVNKFFGLCFALASIQKTNSLLLIRGEQQATAMEANLTRLESKLDAMLAQFEKDVGSSTPTAGAPDSSSKANEDNTETKTDEQSKANKSDQQA